jgi:hypothetical protein
MLPMRITAEPQTSKTTLLVCVSPSSGELAGEVLGPAGVTSFRSRDELARALDEATDPRPDQA